MADPITRSAAGLDLTDRIFESHTVSASPALAAITTITTATWSPSDFPAMLYGCYLSCEVALTIGTSGVSALCQIRRGSSAGTVIASTGAVTVVAGNLYSISAQGVDAVAFVPGQAWVVCLTIGSGAAASTVSSVSLYGIVV